MLYPEVDLFLTLYPEKSGSLACKLGLVLFEAPMTDCKSLFKTILVRSTKNSRKPKLKKNYLVVTCLYL